MLNTKVMMAPTVSQTKGSMPRLTLILSPFMYILVMTLLSLLHLGCALFLVFVAYLYWYLDQPYMEYYSSLLENQSSRDYKFWGFIFLCISGLHVIEILLILFKVLTIPRIIRAGRQKSRFHVVVMNTVTNIQAGPEASGVLNSRANGYVQAIIISLKTLSIRFFSPLVEGLRAVFGRHGLLGVESEHFELVFLLREIVEIVSQAYQTHRSSTLLARRSINNLLVGLLVINCWTTPLFHWILHKRPRIHRIVCVIVDTILCGIMVMVVPIVIFTPYLREFDTTYYTFNVDILYDDAKFAALALENQLIFISSITDGLSKVIPHLTIWSSMHVLRTVFARSKDADNKLSRMRTWRLSRKWWHQICGLDLHAIISCMFVCLSIIALYLHIAAGLRTQLGSHLAHGCKQQISPWFATKYTCAVYEFNCYREQVESPSANALDTLDASALVILILSHCTALVVPPSFQTLKGLIGFEIYNSTLVEWSRDASINSEVHTRLGYTVISHVNLSHFPDGLLVPLPESLTDIEIVKTNLTVLPPNLDQCWHTISVLYVEYNQFNEYPAPLTRMDISDLSVTGNHIISIPSEAFRPDMEWLSLSYNPIQQLPSKVAVTTSVAFLALEYTNITFLPPWIAEYILQETFVTATPYCLSTPDHVSTLVNCVESNNGRYPYDFMETLRRP